MTRIKGLAQVDFSSKDIITGSGVPTADYSTELYKSRLPHLYIDVDAIAIYVYNDSTDTWVLYSAGGGSISTGDNNLDLSISDVLTVNVPNLSNNLGVTDLITLTGMPVNSTDLATFTGTVIPDNVDIKSALQYLESYVEVTLQAAEGLTRNGNNFELGGTVSSKDIDLIFENNRYFQAYADDNSWIIYAQKLVSSSEFGVTANESSFSITSPYVSLEYVNSASSSTELRRGSLFFGSISSTNGVSLECVNDNGINNTVSALKFETSTRNSYLIHNNEGYLGFGDANSPLSVVYPFKWTDRSIFTTFYEQDNNSVIPTASTSQYKAYAADYNSIVGKTSPYFLSEDNKTLSLRRAWHRDIFIEFHPSIELTKYINLDINSTTQIAEFAYDTNQISSLQVSFRKTSDGSSGSFSSAYPITSPLNTTEVDNLNNAIILAPGSGFVQLQITAVFNPAWTGLANIILITEPTNNR